MTLRYTILGCGTSTGVPRIGNEWGDCDPENPRNRRSRSSIIVQSKTTRILVDTSPDMRNQLLAVDISHVDAVLWTHDHADHTHGMDDVRQLFHVRRAPVPGYARPETLALLQTRFAYAFYGRGGYPPIVSVSPIAAPFRVGDIDIAYVDQPHGNIFSTGYRFTCDGKSVGYSVDCHDFTAKMIMLFKGVDVWIVDSLREAPHPTHSHLAQTLAAIQRVKPGLAVLTHMDHSMDYARLCAILPEGVTPAYDLMTGTV